MEQLGKKRSERLSEKRTTSGRLPADGEKRPGHPERPSPYKNTEKSKLKKKRRKEKQRGH